MREVLFVTWTAETIQLSRLPYEGIWESQHELISSFETPRPTRIDRLQSASSRDNVVEALKELKRETALDSEIWFLIPPSWAVEFEVQCPDFDSTDQINDHLLWETQQYLHQDITEFHISRIHIEHNTFRIVAIRNDLFETLIDSFKEAGLDSIYLGIEPDEGAKYKFRPDYDLSITVDINEDQDLPEPFEKSKKPSVVIIGISALLLIIISVFVISTLFDGETETTTDTDETSPDSIRIVQPVVETVETPSVQERETDRLSKMLHILTGSVENINLITITEVEMRIEMTGIDNPDEVLRIIDGNKWLSQSRIAGRFKRDGKTRTVFQSNPIGFNGKNNSRQNLTGWKESAESIGMKSKDRSAFGDYEQALRLIEQNWSDIFGFSKVYISHSKGSWSVTVQ